MKIYLVRYWQRGKKNGNDDDNKDRYFVGAKGLKEAKIIFDDIKFHIKGQKRNGSTLFMACEYGEVSINPNGEIMKTINNPSDQYFSDYIDNVK